VTLFPGDRFELAVTRQAWEAGRIPLAGGFQHLVGHAGEPAPVWLRSESGQSASGVWDGGRALLEVPDLRHLVRLTGPAGRLTLEVEQADARVFRVGLASQAASTDGTVGPAQRDVGGVPVLFARSDADIVQVLADGAHAPLDAYELNRWAHEIALTPGFDELVSLPFLREVIPYEHQVAAVKTVLNRMRGRALLADEVGLGKTVEAGIVLAELLRRRLARRVLVLVPPGLVTQWQEELRRKFRLDFVTHDAEAFKLEGPEAWRRFERVVASFHTAKRAEHAATILDVPYDLVIVDEAHHLRNARTVLWQFVNRLQRTYLLLLTATPVQNDLEELFNLVTLLQPGQLNTLRAFRREHVARGDRRQPRDADGLRRLLAEVMVRNRRATTPVALTRRVARTILVEPSPAERELYSGLSNFLRDRCRRGPEATREPRAAEITRMTLQTVQMELGSSPEAAATTLDRLMAGERWTPDTLEGLKRYRDLARSVGEDAKSRALVSLLGSWGDKLLVFTRFRATQEHLARVLGARGEPVALYHGGLRRDEKEAAVRAFQGPCRVLISTEAGGEGRNLQFAHGLVNYDLPWNPMRIEQRIGRLSRVGQTREVHVFNLVAPGTIEEALLEVLDAKIDMFELVIGEIDMILGQLATEQDFEDIVTDLWLASGDHDAFRARIGALGDQLLAAKRAYLEIREADDRIFGDALAPGGGR
jgi:SNF2 family DNA or RNA helicase